MSGALTLVVKNAIAVVIVHARVGQKLVKSTKLRVLRVANDKFWTLHLRLQTITDAILKPLVKIYHLVWAKKMSLAAICLDFSSASFGIRIN